MSLEVRRRAVRRLDALLLAGLLLTSGAAGLLFALRFYNGDASRAESPADAAPTPTASLAAVSGRATVAPPVVAPLALAGTYAGAPLLLSGQAGPGDILQVYDGQELIAIAVAGEDGVWAAELPGGLLEGEHALAVVAVAEDGATSPRVPVGFAMHLPPTATLTWTPAPTASATPTPTSTATLTATATPTLTPVPSATPDLGTTVEALLAVRMTETAQSWTDTPTVTATPSPTASVTLTETPSPTETDTLTPAPTETPVPTATLTPSPVPPTRTPVSLGPALASPTSASLVLAGARPRIDAPASGEVRAPGPLVARGVAAPDATVVVREQAGGAALAITQASAGGVWTAQFSVARTGPLTLVASASGPDGQIYISDPVTIALAPPVQPISGGMLLPDAQRAGRLFTMLLAVLFVAGGGSAFFAGRLLILLARDHRRKPR